MNDARTGHGLGYSDDVPHRFTYHSPDDPILPEVYRLIRDAGLFAALLVETTTPPSREASLALTHLEEFVMWTNAAIARRGLTSQAQDGAAALADQVWARVDLVRKDFGHDLHGGAERTCDTETGCRCHGPAIAVCPDCPATHVMHDVKDLGGGRHRDAQEWLRGHMRVIHQNGRIKVGEDLPKTDAEDPWAVPDATDLLRTLRDALTSLERGVQSVLATTRNGIDAALAGLPGEG